MLPASSVFFELEAQMTAPASHAAERWWGRGKLDLVAQEIVAPGAIADLVGCVFDRRKLRRRIELGYPPILEWAPLACVSACGSHPQTTRELSLASGLSVSSIRKAVALAVASGALLRDGLELSLNPSWASPARRLVAVELKLTEWRKALTQAATYSQWADEAWVVMGRSVSADLCENATAAGVGVALLDGTTMIVVQKPERHVHAALGVSRLLAGEQVLAQALAQARPVTARGRGVGPRPSLVLAG